jgi:hypothetical protein
MRVANQIECVFSPTGVEVSKAEEIPGQHTEWFAPSRGISVRVMQGVSLRTIDGQLKRVQTWQAKKIEGNLKPVLCQHCEAAPCESGGRLVL